MSKWLHYIGWDNQINKMSVLWVFDVTRWTLGNIPNKKNKKVLDFGCSYFYTGEALAHEFQEVHGYDINPEALQRAALRNVHNAFFYNKLDQIPDQNFNVIVVSSVIQYFKDLDEVDNFFKFASQKLKKNELSTMVITDIIPKNYVSWKDALENIFTAARHGILPAMLAHLFKSIFIKSDVKLLKINSEEIIQIAEKHHFQTRILDTNLTLSTRRYSCVFTLA